MTKNRAAKRAAHTRSEATGERYVVARRAVSEQSELPEWVRPYPFDLSDLSDWPIGVDVVSGEPVGLGRRGLVADGPTGCGKSVAARALIYSALVSGADVAVIDLDKRGLDHEFARPYLLDLATTLDDALALVAHIQERTDDVAGLLNEHGVDRIDELDEPLLPKPILCIVEHANTMLDAPDLAAALGRLIRMGRPFGVHIVLVGQQHRHEQPITAFAAQADFAHTASLRFDIGDTLGRGVMAAHDLDEVSLMQVWYADNATYAAELSKRCRPIPTDARLVPIYDGANCTLRYTETRGHRTHIALVHNDDVVARAHAGNLAPDELNRLTRSPLPAPSDPVALDLDAGEGRDGLVEHNDLMLRITSQLVGSVGLLLDVSGDVAGAWMRPFGSHDRGDTLVLGYEMRSEYDLPAFDMDLEEAFMDTPDDVFVHAISREGIRTIYDPKLDEPADDDDDAFIEMVESRLRDDDVALVASPARIHDQRDAADVAFVVRGPDGWAQAGDYLYVNRERDLTLGDHVTPNDVRLIPTNAVEMVSFGQLPMIGQDASVGESVQVIGQGKWWWKVAARDDRYLVLTRGSRYGVIDLAWNTTYNGVTPGPAMSSLDTLDGGWDDVEHPGAILDALRTGQAELSHRRIVAVDGLVVR